MSAKWFPVILIVNILSISLYLGHVSCVIIRNDNRASKQYCGGTLSGILDQLCLEYNAPEDYKRSGRFSNSYYLSKPIPPFRSEQAALSMFFSRRRRDYVTAYDECCRKGCTMGELLAYCKTPRYTVN